MARSKRNDLITTSIQEQIGEDDGRVSSLAHESLRRDLEVTSGAAAQHE
jgi:hypothetical protein